MNHQPQQAAGLGEMGGHLGPFGAELLPEKNWVMLGQHLGMPHM